MTGFGKKEFPLLNKKFVLEIKTLNGKNLEINSKIHTSVKSTEMLIKNILQQKLFRGTIEISLFPNNSNSVAASINFNAAKEYYYLITQLCQELKIPQENLLELLLKNPEITNGSSNISLCKEEIDTILACLSECIEEVIDFRKREGEILSIDMQQRIELIQNYKLKIITIAPIRIEQIKKKLQQKLQQLTINEKYSQDRFEQELIYYCEKIDFTEEITRFDAHCQYFITVLNDHNIEISKGKKLGFIVQEISREINTLGSKAQNADIQKLVIMMKDEVEKIKEQINNIL